MTQETKTIRTKEDFENMLKSTGTIADVEFILPEEVAAAYSVLRKFAKPEEVAKEKFSTLKRKLEEMRGAIQGQINQATANAIRSGALYNKHITYVHLLSKLTHKVFVEDGDLPVDDSDTYHLPQLVDPMSGQIIFFTRKSEKKVKEFKENLKNEIVEKALQDIAAFEAACKAKIPEQVKEGYRLFCIVDRKRKEMEKVENKCDGIDFDKLAEEVNNE
ncbi:hypothetical protein BF128_004561 [Escherichia coli]|nr:hypothetical protein [Escherichia coli]